MPFKITDTIPLDFGVHQVQVEHLHNREWIKSERRRKAKYRKFRLRNLAIRKLVNLVRTWKEFCARSVVLRNAKYSESDKMALFEF